MKTTTLQNLGIYLGTSSDVAISLKDLILQQFDGNVIPCNLALTITLAPSVVVTLVDDLVSLESCWQLPAIQQRIEFVLHRYSQLDYNCALAAQKNTPCLVAIEKELIVRLTGQSAQATLHCSWHGTDQTACTFKTIQDHQAEKTKSSLMIKGVLDDYAKISCTNLLKVSKNAAHVVAEQTNKNLILSHEAKVISVPQLEIENNNAQCHHGAAVSRLDDEHLFYLQSRGFTCAASKQMMIEGFLRSNQWPRRTGAL